MVPPPLLVSWWCVRGWVSLNATVSVSSRSDCGTIWCDSDLKKAVRTRKDV